jgi:uncharacterized protein
MNRRDLLLGILASAEGRSFTPVQIQKAVFLVCRNVPSLIDSGPLFNFRPYDYGPFDATVYAEADALCAAGDAVIIASGNGWNVYAASDDGVAHGRIILQSVDPHIRDYIRNISAWVRAQSFSGLVNAIYDAYPEMRINSIFRG